ncbi:MAG: LacI family DNA-binding transcriptional regulator [Inquilinaceae bacterium]
MVKPTPPTIRDVASLADVSTATVSNVLNNKRHVSAPRRRRVLQAVEQLDYRPNNVAASLRHGRTGLVGLVVPDVTNPFFAAIVKRIEEAAAGSDYQLMLVTGGEDPQQEESRVHALLARRTEGLIIIPSGDDAPILDALRAERHRMIVVDRCGDEHDATGDAICVDNRTAAYDGTRHLIDLGHRDIALVISTETLSNMRARIAGYRDALAESGLDGRERLVAGGLSVDSSRRAVERMLSHGPRPTAVFAASNPATLGAIQAIRALDIDFPAAMSLLGFDDFDWMTVLRPYLSTIRQPVEDIAEAAWRRLTDRLAGREVPAGRIELRCTLCVRESTLPPAQRGGAP